ncbi:MAG: hypothetical protein Q9221_004936 [Calogaya cf. arnoldii]
MQLNHHILRDTLVSYLLASTSVVATTTSFITKASALNQSILTPFDSTPAAATGPSPVGIENRLFYNAFNTRAFGLNGQTVTGLVAQSHPNVAATGITERMSNGTATISIQYTTTKSFGITSLYVGLLITTGQGVATVPTDGTVEVTGYKAVSDEVAGPTILSFVAVANEKLQVPLQKKSLPKGFQAGLGRLTLEPSSAVGGTTLTALNIDDVMGLTTF